MLASMAVAASPVPNCERNLELTFQVVDADSRNPIAGALVGVIYPHLDNLVRPSFGKTQADGSAHFSHTFLVGEVSSLVPDPKPFRAESHFFRGLDWDRLQFRLFPIQCAFTIHAPNGWHHENTRHVCYGDRWLEISAPGYRHLAIPLTLYIGEIGNLDAPTPPPIRIEMHRGDSLAGSLTEWAGDYREMNSVRGARLRILADGRFAFFTHDWESDRPEYGYAGIDNDEFRFLPEKHHDYLTRFPHESQKFTAVAWGARHYIVETSGLRAFCEQVHEGKVCDCHFGPMGGVYLRVGDEKVKPRGLPELPRKWASFLIPGPIAGKIENVYADGLAKVSLGRIDGVLGGMIFTAHGIGTHSCQQVEVVHVNVDSCIVRLYHSDPDAPRSMSPGDRVTVPFEGDGWPRGDHSGQ
jgi:hypothetical protein